MRFNSRTIFIKAFFLILFLFLFLFLFNEKIIAQEDLTLKIFDFDKEKEINKIKLVPCGITIGVKINTEGVMVLETDNIKLDGGLEINPSKELLSGDLILSVNNHEINKKEDLINEINLSDDLNLKIKRNKIIKEIEIKPVKNLDGENKIGAWVRDSTQGVGTLTYFNLKNKKFGALGHGVIDVDTRELMTVKSGEMKKIMINSLIKSKLGTPGEVISDAEDGELIGKIKLNNKFGLYGLLDVDFKKIVDFDNQKELFICDKSEIHEGFAKLRSNVSGELKDYDVYIESVNKFNSDNDVKNMVIKITDGELLEKTNGIIQGMSGCPIIQDDKLIGALTHVFIKDPSRGYAVFISNMIEQENNI
ncbi:MAG: SpoIVB peptidase [Clostridiales bacterium]|jgi:stage IV sporulation protein B|nr:SpoIVB peptidase [Clostridiales bacterium]